MVLRLNKPVRPRAFPRDVKVDVLAGLVLHDYDRGGLSVKYFSAKACEIISRRFY